MVYSPNAVSWYSATGPTADLRFKPDVMGVGDAIRSADSDGDLSTGNAGFIEKSGTSMAAATVAAVAALAKQYFRDGFYPDPKKPSNASGFNTTAAFLKAILIMSTQPVPYRQLQDPYMYGNVEALPLGTAAQPSLLCCMQTSQASDNGVFVKVPGANAPSYITTIVPSKTVYNISFAMWRNLTHLGANYVNIAIRSTLGPGKSMLRIQTNMNLGNVDLYFSWTGFATLFTYTASSTSTLAAVRERVDFDWTDPNAAGMSTVYASLHCTNFDQRDTLWFSVTEYAGANALVGYVAPCTQQFDSYASQVFTAVGILGQPSTMFTVAPLGYVYCNPMVSCTGAPVFGTLWYNSSSSICRAAQLQGLLSTATEAGLNPQAVVVSVFQYNGTRRTIAGTNTPQAYQAKSSAWNIKPGDYYYTLQRAWAQSSDATKNPLNLESSALTGQVSADQFLAQNLYMPNYLSGFGRPQLDRILPLGVAGSSGSNLFVWARGDAPSVISHNQNVTYCVTVPFNVVMVRVTLAWTDPAPATAVMNGKSLINDLDLTLVAANGTVLQIGNGDSVPDRANNVETIVWAGGSTVIDPLAKQGIVCAVVHGYHVPMAPQRYALVASVILPEPISDCQTPCANRGLCWAVGQCSCQAGWSTISSTDCVMSAFENVGSCSVACGGGIQQVVRRVLTPPLGRGQACPTDNTKTSMCNLDACPLLDRAVNCTMSAFQPSGVCSVTCGGGVQQMVRTVVTPAANGGTACPDPTTNVRTDPCNTQVCPTNPAPCSAPCPLTCNNGGFCMSGLAAAQPRCACRRGWYGDTCTLTVPPTPAPVTPVPNATVAPTLAPEDQDNSTDTTAAAAKKKAPEPLTILDKYLGYFVGVGVFLLLLIVGLIGKTIYRRYYPTKEELRGRKKVFKFRQRLDPEDPLDGPDAVPPALLQQAPKIMKWMQTGQVKPAQLAHVLDAAEKERQLREMNKDYDAPASSIELGGMEDMGDMYPMSAPLPASFKLGAVPERRPDGGRYAPVSPKDLDRKHDSDASEDEGIALSLPLASRRPAGAASRPTSAAVPTGRRTTRDIELDVRATTPAAKLRSPTASPPTRMYEPDAPASTKATPPPKAPLPDRLKASTVLSPAARGSRSTLPPVIGRTKSSDTTDM